MYNVDAIIFARNLTSELAADGLFDPSIDLFLDEKFFYDELVRVADENVTAKGNPLISDEQFDEVLIESRRKCIDDTMTGLVEQGILKVSGMTKDGDFSLNLCETLKIK